MERISALINSYINAYSKYRELDKTQLQELKAFFLHQYLQSPPHVKITLTAYFYFSNLVCIILFKKTLKHLNIPESKSFFIKLNIFSIYPISKVSHAVKSLLEFRILELI